MALQLAFPLVKPSANEYVTEATEIGITIDGTTKSLQDAADDGDIGGGGGSELDEVLEKGNGTGSVQIKGTLAIGSNSFAEGNSTMAIGDSSHAEGYYSDSPTTVTCITSVTDATGTAYFETSEDSELKVGMALLISDEIVGYISEISTETDVNEEDGEETVTEKHKIVFLDSEKKYSFVKDKSYTFCKYTCAFGDYSHAEGDTTNAIGEASHAEGCKTVASGDYSHVEGTCNTASGDYSHAEGDSTTASGEASHAEGYETVASGEYSHAEGMSGEASGNYSHVEGTCNTASGIDAHAEGDSNTASGDASHTEGTNTTASGENSHSEGEQTDASGKCSHAEGSGTTASGTQSHAEGGGTTASGTQSHAEGAGSKASGEASHAEGSATTASGPQSHAEGGGSKATASCAHAEGGGTNAIGSNSHSEGSAVIAFGNNSHAEGSCGNDTKVSLTTATINFSGSATSVKLKPGTPLNIEVSADKGKIAESKGAYFGDNAIITAYTVMKVDNEDKITITLSSLSSDDVTLTKNTTYQIYFKSIAFGISSHSEGVNTIATAYASHAEGNKTKASGNYSHAEGSYSIASKDCSHAEGGTTTASGLYSHAEGEYTTASGDHSHAEGYGTSSHNNIASGQGSHTEGEWTIASGEAAHAEGYNNKSIGDYSHTEGSSNKSYSSNCHTEGTATTAGGVWDGDEIKEPTDKMKSMAAHAEGMLTNAVGRASHTEGYYTITNNEGEHAEGKYNASHTDSNINNKSKRTAHSVGIGQPGTLKNAHEIMENGDHYFGDGELYLGHYGSVNKRYLSKVYERHVISSPECKCKRVEGGIRILSALNLDDGTYNLYAHRIKLRTAGTDELFACDDNTFFAYEGDNWGGQGIATEIGTSVPSGQYNAVYVCSTSPTPTYDECRYAQNELNVKISKVVMDTYDTDDSLDFYRTLDSTKLVEGYDRSYIINVDSTSGTRTIDFRCLSCNAYVYLNIDEKCDNETTIIINQGSNIEMADSIGCTEVNESPDYSETGAILSLQHDIIVYANIDATPSEDVETTSDDE